MSNTFSDRQASCLRAERNRRGITQKKLASLIGVSEDSVVRWERGDCIMSFKNAYNISVELGCSISDLCKEQ